ncbi:hypothetical protein [Kitasatospora sp. SUK 42]|uniref:hypothetical protein n=1 Tax=Kitasatospora sp. SUK 42 TaxID=1588882 RepID=UPI0018CACB42|nr:hypothetical protein [Kitasatospora sp. SUK 42]MBV2155664.1 hypothetical protein [Kitasatospora sp. SUK 42]
MRTGRVVAVAIAAAVLVGCQGGGGTTGGGTAADGPPAGGTAAGGPAQTRSSEVQGPEEALKAAAEVMRKAGNGTFTLAAPTGHGLAPGAGGLAWSGADAAIEYTADTPDTRLRTRVVGAEAYVGLTEPTAATAPPGPRWYKVGDVPWRASPSNAVMLLLSRVMNPVAQLDAARTAGASPGAVETVDGERLTRYRVVEEAKTVLATIPGLDQGDEPGHRTTGFRNALQRSGSLTVDLWLNDRQELVRYRAYGEKEGPDQAIVVRYANLGGGPALAAPPQGETGRLADMMELIPDTRTPGPSNP